MGRGPGLEADLEAARDCEARAEHPPVMLRRTRIRRIHRGHTSPSSFVDLRMLALSCPTWCDGQAASPMCFACAVHAVEDGDLDPSDVTVGPVPAHGHDATGSH